MNMLDGTEPASGRLDRDPTPPALIMMRGNMWYLSPRFGDCLLERQPCPRAALSLVRIAESLAGGRHQALVPLPFVEEHRAFYERTRRARGSCSSVLCLALARSARAANAGPTSSAETGPATGERWLSDERSLRL
jgi:hypothetical protein